MTSVDTDSGGGSEQRQAWMVVAAGSGFAGFHTCRVLERLLPSGASEITLVSPTDYLLYSPLLPEVAAGVMDARYIVVPLSQGLRRTVPVLGFAVDTDLDLRQVSVQQPDGRTLRPDCRSW